MGKLVTLYVSLILSAIALAYGAAAVSNLVAPQPHSIEYVRANHVSLEEAATAKTLAETELIEAEAAAVQTNRVINSVSESVWMVAKFIGVALFAVFGLLLFGKFANLLRNQER